MNPDPQLDAAARLMLGAAPMQTEAAAAAGLEAFMREARHAYTAAPTEQGGSRDGLDLVTHTAAVEHFLFPDGLMLSDLEPITPERAAAVADRAAQAIIDHIYET